MLATIVTIYALLSLLASILILSAAKLSSRLSQREQLVEVYDTVEETQPIVPATYSLES
jgi:predicted lysophospholipase L1 biosynthesis ABC-type transport system permease subunit